MARIRTIKPEFWSSEQIVECSTSARLLFIGMWNFCDDGGIMPANCRTLKMRVFPGDEISSSNIRRTLDELINADLVAEYDVENVTYWGVTGWAKHQKIDRPTKKYPPIPSDHSPSPRLPFVEPSPPGRESKGRESKGRDSLSDSKEESESTFSEPIRRTLDELSPDHPEKALYDFGKQLLGSGGMVAKLLASQGGNIEKAMDVLLVAQRKSDPREYVGRVLKPKTQYDDFVDPGL